MSGGAAIGGGGGAAVGADCRIHLGVKRAAVKAAASGPGRKGWAVADLASGGAVEEVGGR